MTVPLVRPCPGVKPPVRDMGTYGTWQEKLWDVTEKSVRRDQQYGQHPVSRLGLTGGCRCEKWPDGTERSTRDLLGSLVLQGHQCLGKPSGMPLKSQRTKAMVSKLSNLGTNGENLRPLGEN